MQSGEFVRNEFVVVGCSLEELYINPRAAKTVATQFRQSKNPTKVINKSYLPATQLAARASCMGGRTTLAPCCCPCFRRGRPASLQARTLNTDTRSRGGKPGLAPALLLGRGRQQQKAAALQTVVEPWPADLSDEDWDTVIRYYAEKARLTMVDVGVSEK